MTRRQFLDWWADRPFWRPAPRATPVPRQNLDVALEDGATHAARWHTDRRYVDSVVFVGDKG